MRDSNKVLFKYKSEASPSEPTCLARENKCKNSCIMQINKIYSVD